MGIFRQFVENRWKRHIGKEGHCLMCGHPTMTMHEDEEFCSPECEEKYYTIVRDRADSDHYHGEVEDTPSIDQAPWKNEF